MGLNNSLLKINGTRHLGQEVPCFALFLDDLFGWSLERVALIVVAKCRLAKLAYTWLSPRMNSQQYVLLAYLF